MVSSVSGPGTSSCGPWFTDPKGRHNLAAEMIHWGRLQSSKTPQTRRGMCRISDAIGPTTMRRTGRP